MVSIGKYWVYLLLALALGAAQLRGVTHGYYCDISGHYVAESSGDCHSCGDHEDEPSEVPHEHDAASIELLSPSFASSAPVHPPVWFVASTWQQPISLREITASFMARWEPGRWLYDLEKCFNGSPPELVQSIVWLV
jgi:hypothetical protein